MITTNILRYTTFTVSIFLLASCRENASQDTGNTIPGDVKSSSKTGLHNDSRADHSSSSSTSKALRQSLLKASEAGPYQVQDLVADLLKKDEQSFIESLRHLNGPANYDVIGQTLFEHFRDSDRLEDGLRAFETIGQNPDISAPLLETFTTAYWEQHPEKAMDWLLKHGDYEGIEHALLTIGYRTGSQAEPEQRVQSVLDSDLPNLAKASFLTGFMREWSEHDLQSAFGYMASLPSSEVTNEALYHIAQKASTIDPDAAKQWAEHISDEGFRQSAIEQINESLKK